MKKSCDFWIEETNGNQIKNAFSRDAPNMITTWAIMIGRDSWDFNHNHKIAQRKIKFG